MSEPFLRRLHRRLHARSLPQQDEIHTFGARGEEAIYRKLRECFDCVIRNPVVPWGEGYLEKDFLVVQKGVPVVLEIKNWKGRISAADDHFCQDKPGGIHKDLKSPVASTNRFLDAMRDFYDLEQPVKGAVVFAEPDCVLDLPPEMDGVALIPGEKIISTVRTAVKAADKDAEKFDPARALHCARLYGGNREFCGGVVVDKEIPCYTELGVEAALNPLFVQYINLDHQPFRLRDKMTVTFTNGSSGIFYNHCSSLTLHCLDGDVTRVALSRLKTVVF